MRGNLDEGEPHGLPGTYLNSFYEVRPLPYAEAGFGYPEAGQTIVDVTNGKLLRLLVDDEPFDVRYGDLLEHERVLDMRAGTLTRTTHWRSPVGKQVKVVSTRLVSLVQRSVAAIEYTVEAVDEFVRVTVQSELVANEDQPRTSRDPRVSAVLNNPLEAVHHENTDTGALLIHRTRSSELMMAAAMDHDVEVPGRVEVHTEAREDLARTTVICGLRPGQTAAHRQVPRLRVVQPALAPGAAGSSGRSGQRRALHRMGRPAAYPARIPRRVLGQRRCGGRGRPRQPAGRAVRTVPRVAGQCTRRTPGDRGQGADGHRLRRSCVLGHRGIRAATAHLHRTARGRRRAALAGVHAGYGQGARRTTRPHRRRIPVAHDPR